MLTLQKTDSKLTRLERIVDEMFIGEYDLEAVEDAAADAMVKALGDRWSYYIPAGRMVQYTEQMENAYVGVGITIQKDEETQEISVMKVEPTGGAAEQGIAVGDILIAVENQSVAEKSVEEIADVVRGKEGTTVQMTLRRGTEEYTAAVMRKTIQTPVVESRMLDAEIGYIKILNFDSRCAASTLAAIDELQAQGAKKLLFDVRFNPGGYAEELVTILDRLLPEGELFRTVDYRGRIDVDTSDSDCLGIPLAVMVNGDSYSAAEFFAAALQEYGAATIVGQKTVGKGYFQITQSLGDGSAVGLSVGKYYTPKGISLDGIGVTPDYPVEMDEEAYYALYLGTLSEEDDTQMQKAIEILKEKQS